MKHKRFALVALMPFLFSCAGIQENPTYVKELKANGDEDFNVLQFTDIHWNYSTNIKEASAFLENTVKVAKERNGHIDLIEITGDSLLVANKKIATTLYDLIDSWNIPWAFTFGNHDYEGEWSEAWMNHLVSSSNYKNALMPENGNDGLSGYSNYVLNIKWGEETKWQIYNIDTHNLIQDGGSYDYDYIHEDQVEWYKARTEEAKANNGGEYVPSLAFFHIPPTEINTIEKDGEHLGGIKEEKFCPGVHDSKFFNEAKERKCKGMFFGHDHSNDIVWKYQGVVFGYGVKANTELYSTEKDGISITGASICSLHKGGTFDLEHLIINYDEPEKGATTLTWKESNL